MRMIRKTGLILCLAVVLFLPKGVGDASAQNAVDYAAFAVGFSCAGPVALGQLFDNGMGRCDPQGTANLFSNAVCTYENIVDQVLGKLYCGMQWSLLEPLGALMVMFVTLIGAGFAVGILPFTARETVLALFKFGLVYYFATESQLTIELIYEGLMGFIQDTVLMVMAHVAPTVGSLSGPGGLFDRMDEILAEFANNAAVSQDPDNPCEAGLIAMFMTFVGTVPMLAFFGVGMAIQFVLVFFQMILGYFIAITGIMFLTALAPIFLSFALFKFTRNYFDQWVGYLLSFAVQVFVVAAFIGVIISLELDEDLQELFELARPYTVVQQVEGVRVPYREWCSICEPTEFGAFGITCKSEDPLHPHSLLTNPDTVRIFGTRLLKILILAYILHKAMIAVPGVARAIGAARHAPAIAGVDVFIPSRSIRYPGMEGLGRGAQSMTRTDGIRQAFNPLVTGRN